MKKNKKKQVRIKRPIPLIHIIQGLFWAFVLINYPGQNYWQTLTLHPQVPKVRGFSTMLPPLSIPIAIDKAQVPTISAQAAIVFEPDSGTMIWGKNIDEQLHPASTTKLLTALTALDLYKPDQILTVKNTDQVVGSALRLKAGDKFTTTDLLKALLIPSANDAALTFAENDQAGYAGFMNTMQNKINSLHLSNTHFTNVSGLDDDNHKTSVHDLALVAKAISASPLLLDITSQKSATISSQNGHTYKLVSTNQLLGTIPGIKGLKTGWTEVAGECLVTLVERGDRKLITVVLDSQDRFGDSKALIEWAWAHFVW